MSPTNPEESNLIKRLCLNTGQIRGYPKRKQPYDRLTDTVLDSLQYLKGKRIRHRILWKTTTGSLGDYKINYTTILLDKWQLFKVTVSDRVYSVSLFEGNMHMSKVVKVDEAGKPRTLYKNIYEDVNNEDKPIPPRGQHPI